MSTSILTEIKKMLNVAELDTSFDTDIIVNINAAFMILHQLGVGPTTEFSIEDSSAAWEDFLEDPTMYLAAKTYVYLRVKVIFDPPGTSFVLDSIARQVAELEWRLMVKADPPVEPDPIIPEEE